MARGCAQQSRTRGKDVTIGVLAKTLGISPATFARIETGERRLGLAEADTIAKMTGVPLRFLLEGWAIFYEGAPLTSEAERRRIGRPWADHGAQ